MMQREHRQSHREYTENDTEIGIKSDTETTQSDTENGTESDT